MERGGLSIPRADEHPNQGHSIALHQPTGRRYSRLERASRKHAASSSMQRNSTGGTRSILRLFIAVFVVVSGLLFQAHITKPGQIAADQLLYLSIASDIVETGRFTDGITAGVMPRERRAGMMVAPLYPAFLAVLMVVDPKLAATARCWSVWQLNKDTICPNASIDLGLLMPAQFALAAICLLTLWRAAAAVTRSEPVAWIALTAAAFGCYEYAAFARWALTENLAAALICAFSLHLFLAIKGGTWRFALVAGIELGLASLTRPQFIYLGYAIAFVLVGAALAAAAAAAWRSTRWVIANGALLCAGCAAIVLPWLIRNAIVMGSFDLTQGYGPMSLTQRLAFDDIRGDEYVAAWIYFLPDFGPSIASLLFSPASYHRLSLNQAPDTFFAMGSTVVFPQTLAAAGGPAHHMHYLIQHSILSDLPKYAAVTLLLAWRGIWVGKYFSIVCVPLLAKSILQGLFGRNNDLLVFSAPALLLLVFQAAVSVSISRYNIFLIPSMSIAAGLAFHRIFASVRSHLVRRGGHV